jgi:hypothetical protein
MDVTVNRVPGTYYIDLYKNENVVLKFSNSNWELHIAFLC